MSQARELFISRMAGASHASQHQALIGVTSSNEKEIESARLLRNGLSVTCFAALEGFINARLGEIARWLSDQSIPYSKYPSSLHDAASKRAVQVLGAQLQRSNNDNQIAETLRQLSSSWSRMKSGGAWILPHAALLWPHSNLKADEAIAILSSVSSGKNWSQLGKLARSAGMPVAPSKELFNSIGERRNSSAHDANYDADILMLRSAPEQIVAFAFAFDALISCAARRISRLVEDLDSTEPEVQLIRLEQDCDEKATWYEINGSVLNPTAVVTKTHKGEIAEILSKTCTTTLDPYVVVVVREWSGREHKFQNWRTPGI